MADRSCGCGRGCPYSLLLNLFRCQILAAIGTTNDEGLNDED